MKTPRANSQRKFSEKRKSGFKLSNLSAKFFLKHTREFCDKTSLHGFKYVTEEGSHWIQSVFWGTCIVLGIVFCSILMVLIWSRFSSNPTITAVETVSYPVWKIPFPAVTVCDVNKVHRGKIDRIKNILTSNRISEERAVKFFESLAFLINFMEITETFSDIFKVLARNNIKIDAMMLELASTCSELLTRCTWMGNLIECSKLFKLIKTDEGFCCSFNYFHTNETYDRGEDAKSIFKIETTRTAAAGIQTGISVVIKINESNYMSQTRSIPSAIIMAHIISDYPEMRTHGTLVKMGELVHLPVEAFVIDTTSDVKTLAYTVRNCTFENEITLTIGEYGYDNCIIECRMDTIVALCNCIPFYYNFQNYKHKNVQQCNFEGMKCVANHFRLLYTLSPEETHSNASEGLQCKCYPFCDINWYTYPVDVGYMNVENLSLSEAVDITGMHVYFSEFSCIKYKQSNLITWDGLFASFGGIFGLCLGGSILSVVEIVYHFTISLYVSLKNKNKRQSKNAQDPIDHTSKILKNIGLQNNIPPNDEFAFYYNMNKQILNNRLYSQYKNNYNTQYNNKIQKRY